METTLASLLSTLARLDRNGWATLTDGSLDGMTLAEKIETVQSAINCIKANA
jgi:hypothetical protein